ncbi:TetR/AcrR family transcriptional regulator [Microbacterium gorillae]|uniref:TetR/AcrR family transcriptional regulator n=1 Tax=Microbacterium gorillae TaxID=1231063 RepID=UPI00058D59CA|nr:TetR/AcrR family transcriptional regulator [Microbacterium gorillae]
MARTKEFDPDKALDDAMSLFWQRGYEATSMSDLVDELGVARASLYATFGDKHSLYLKALDRYTERRDPVVVERLSAAGSPLAAVRAFVAEYGAEIIADKQPRGCLVVNTAVERLPGDDEAALRVRASWQTLEVALTAALSRAKAEGELPGGSDPRALARFVVVFLQGLRVVGKADPSLPLVRDALAQFSLVLGA